jgi:uncharacterized phage infection (PIP) family protein YhgE
LHAVVRSQLLGVRVAFSLDKKEHAELQNYISALRNKEAQIREEEEAMTAALAQMTDGVNGLVQQYNAILADAQAFVEGKASEFRDAYDEKSEKWQEGDRGQATESFTCDWENADLQELEEISIVEPDTIEANAADVLEGLPESPDY